jgi:hypothetical protein
MAATLPIQNRHIHLMLSALAWATSYLANPKYEHPFDVISIGFSNVFTELIFCHGEIIFCG